MPVYASSNLRWNRLGGDDERAFELADVVLGVLGGFDGREFAALDG